MYVCMYVASFNDFEIYIFHSFDTTPNRVAVSMYFYNKICPFSRVLFKVHCYIKMTKNQKNCLYGECFNYAYFPNPSTHTWWWMLECITVWPPECIACEWDIALNLNCTIVAAFWWNIGKTVGVLHSCIWNYSTV